MCKEVHQGVCVCVWVCVCVCARACLVNQQSLTKRPSVSPWRADVRRLRAMRTLLSTSLMYSTARCRLPADCKPVHGAA